MYPLVETQEQTTFCRIVLMKPNRTSPKGQTYVNVTYHDEYEMTQYTQDRSTQNKINISQQNKLNHFESVNQTKAVEKFKHPNSQIV